MREGRGAAKLFWTDKVCCRPRMCDKKKEGGAVVSSGCWKVDCKLLRRHSSLLVITIHLWKFRERKI